MAPPPACPCAALAACRLADAVCEVAGIVGFDEFQRRITAVKLIQIRGTAFSDGFTDEDTACLTYFSLGAPPFGSPGSSAAKHKTPANEAVKTAVRHLLKLFFT